MNKIFLVLLCFVATNMIGQDYRVGKISKEELQEKVYNLDTTANAVKLYVNKRVYFNYLQGEGFQLITEVHERIKIYNKEGYDWATKEIKYYSAGGSKSEKLNIQEARTYVLENGKIEDYKLKNSEVFTEVINKYWSADKFTMPNVVDGCIVEWKYKITSPYKSIDKVVLQTSIPVKKFEAKIEIPEYYHYNVKHSGYIPINSTKESKNDYIFFTEKIRDGRGIRSDTSSNFSNQKVEFRTNVTSITNENIPALIEEPYVNEISNYASAVHFELASLQWPQSPIEYFSQTWDDVTKTIYNNDDFGSAMNIKGYFKEDLEALVIKTGGNQKKLIVEIFEFVKRKVKWNKIYGIYTYNGVREAYKKGEGNVADINFILVGMLREANINANPIILSTRSNGIPLFPTIDGFNYVIAGVEVENDVILLDATESNSTLGILPNRALNWQGRIVRESGSSAWVSLISKHYAETNSTASITLNTDGSISGTNRIQYANFDALKYRNKYASLSDDKIFETIEEKYSLEIGEGSVSNKTDLYVDPIESISFTKNNAIDNIGGKLYFKPLFFNTITTNPFKLEKRDYPIEFGHPFLSKDLISIEIPEGYEIEFLPESFAVGLPNNGGLYRLSISSSLNKINVYSLLKIDKADFHVEDYEALKEFFKRIVSKHAEQVVLAKKPS